MRVYGKRRKDPKIKTTGTRGFPLGLNQLTHPTTIKNTELAEAQNVLYSQNGVLSKRPGSVNLGEPRGESTKVLALQGVYNIGDPATDYLLRISDDGILQYYSFFSSTWIDVPSSPTFSSVDTQILQGYGYVYLLNPEDDMVKWDGDSFSTFDALANPSTKPTLTKQGSATGAMTYYYRYVWYNDVGNTLASPAETIASMPEELDADTYVKVDLPAAPAGAEQVGIFRGTTAGDEMYLAKIPATQTTYNDKGFDEPDPLYGVPESNTTGGFHFKFATVYRNTLIGITTELGDDMLVFSAGGDKFDSFGRADGGGYYGWRRDDGDPITAVCPFQDELFVFKTGKVGAFTFDTEGASIRDINLAVGAVSHRSVHAAGNDLRFWSREGAYSLGNEPNFADLIRTKVLSARADQIVQSLTPTEFDHISGVFYKDHSLWGLPMGGADEGITSCIAYNEKYAAWTEWFGLTPNVWAKFVDSSNRERLFYGDAQSGNVVECWEGTDDRGDAITWRVATKQFDMDRPHQYKTFGRVYFIFGNVTGTGTRITLVEDGVRSQVPLALYAEVGDMGFGVDEWGTMEFGDSSGEFTGDVSGLTVRYVDLGNKDLFSLQAILTNAGMSDQIDLMGMLIEYAESAQPLPASKRLNRVLE
jgi:hypothetical protein